MKKFIVAVVAIVMVFSVSFAQGVKKTPAKTEKKPAAKSQGLKLNKPVYKKIPAPKVTTGRSH